MRFDMHCHLLGNSKDINQALNDQDIYYNPYDNAADLSRFFIKNIVAQFIQQYMKGYGANIIDGGISSEDYIDFLYQMFIESKEIDGLVLLAMDACYSNKTHTLQEKETDLLITNRFLSEKVNELNLKLSINGISGKKFYFGASVNPNRPDWQNELNYVCNETDAVLLKWIPSVLDIEVGNEIHKPFYEMMKQNNLPLLCHVGPEMAFSEGINNKEKDDFHCLKLPIECGVKVIAAHCASPMFPGQDKDIYNFLEFIKQWNNNGSVRLWADISALSMTTRIPFISKYVNEFSEKWLMNGSDFPVPIEGYMHFPKITYDVSFPEYFDIINEKNPFDLDVKIKKAHKFNSSIFENAENVLRMPG
jgi:hypothetical protein